jgi:hypothetical protein
LTVFNPEVFGFGAREYMEDLLGTLFGRGPNVSGNNTSASWPSNPLEARGVFDAIERYISRNC